MPKKAIARELGLSLNTVRRALSFDEAPADGRSSRASVADEYEPRILEILSRDPNTAATEIAREIGWPRSMTVLRDRVRALRPTGPDIPGAREPGTSKAQRLPAAVTSFVARRRELATIRSLLGSARLLTLTGPGGIGKTRLALKAAEQFSRAFRDGVWYVELAGLRNPALLAQTFVDHLGLAHHDGAAAYPENILTAHFRDRQTLLVVDNCEHLVQSCSALIEKLLVNAPGLRVVATSRQSLGLAAEQLLVVPPLGVPGADGTDDDDDAAMVLFATRAAAIVPAFTITDANGATIERICRQLDGVPLGIELAAIQLRVLSVTELQEHFADRMLTMQARNASGRHDSLEAAIHWSYDLCSAQEQLVWARASVFAGGFDRRACAAVCGDDVAVLDAIGGLVEKSILQREELDGRVRFRMLEPIREFGRERLASAELLGCQRRHLAWCVDLIGQCANEWFGLAQTQWYRRIRVEQANIRAALEHAVEHGDTSSAQHIVGDAWFLWALLSLKEHGHWLAQVRSLSGGDDVARGRCLATQSLVLTLQGDRDGARRCVAESEAIAEVVPDPSLVAFNTHQHGLTDFFEGDFAAAGERLLAAQTIYEQEGVAPDLSGSLRVHLGLLGVFDGHLDWAERQLHWILSRSQECGEQWLAAYATSAIGFVALAREQFDDAAERAGAALTVLSGFRDATGVGLSLDLLAWAESARGSYDRAAVLFGAASSMWQSFGEQLYGSEHWLAQRTRFREQVRDALGPRKFEQAFRAGSAMTRERVLEYALDLSQPAHTSDLVEWETDLTTREREIARLVAEGLTNKQIAALLVVSPRTVEGHVGNVLRKLGLERRSQLAALASATPVGVH